MISKNLLFKLFFGYVFISYTHVRDWKSVIQIFQICALICFEAIKLCAKIVSIFFPKKTIFAIIDWYYEARSTERFRDSRHV